MFNIIMLKMKPGSLEILDDRGNYHLFHICKYPHPLPIPIQTEEKHFEQGNIPYKTEKE